MPGVVSDRPGPFLPLLELAAGITARCVAWPFPAPIRAVADTHGLAHLRPGRRLWRRLGKRLRRLPWCRSWPFGHRLHPPLLLVGLRLDRFRILSLIAPLLELIAWPIEALIALFLLLGIFFPVLLEVAFTFQARLAGLILLLGGRELLALLAEPVLLLILRALVTPLLLLLLALLLLLLALLLLLLVLLLFSLFFFFPLLICLSVATG
jgi:hypothetical protein